MTAQRRKRSWIAGGFLLAIAAAIAGIWMMLGPSHRSPAGRPVPEPESRPASKLSIDSGLGIELRPGDTTITLSPDKLANAHFKIEEAVLRKSNSELSRVTGTVQSNAYKEVPILAIAGGIVRDVNVGLGDQVRRGQKLATIFSTDLADAQTSYLGMQAGIEQHHQHYHRAEQL